MQRLLAVFIVALLAGLIATLPLKLVLGLTGHGIDLSRAEIHGSIWNGTIRGARFGQLSIRRAKIHTRPWPLLGGRLAIDWVLADAGLRGSGLAWIDLQGDWQARDAHLVGVPVRLGCRGGDLVAALAGESEDMSIAAEMSFGLTDIAWRLGITTANPDLGNALAYSAFNLSDGVWRRNGEMRHAD